MNLEWGVQNESPDLQDEAELRALMIRAQAGDKESYRELLLRLRTKSLQISRAILISAGKKISIDMEDVAQDVLLTIHRQLKTYRSEHAFLPWFNAIVRHRTIDLLRSHKVNENIDDHVGDLAADPEPFSQEFEQAELRNLLETLPAKLKQVLQLTKVEGRSVSEVSRLLNISESDVKVSTFRAIESLKKARKGDHEK